MEVIYQTKCFQTSWVSANLITEVETKIFNQNLTDKDKHTPPTLGSEVTVVSLETCLNTLVPIKVLNTTKILTHQTKIVKTAQ